ncbi:MAG: peptidoglycan bridge formation glycyltransferase FemA/FemB family protein [Spirochaetales bacterium]|nr:peptidoglycan bridge formation glycyltransferase FemA/FemB family protein [Spirochaetales bacterium]
MINDKKFSIRHISIDDLDSNRELFQTGFWGRFKAQFGWVPVPLKIGYEDIESNLLVLMRSLRFGLHIGYIPMGPDIPEPKTGKEEFLIHLAHAVKEYLPSRITFLRFDLPWGRQGEGIAPGPLQQNKKLIKAPTDIQPPHTVILRIDKPEDEILGGMKHKTRYNIRLSAKKGVIVKEESPEKLTAWYELYKETAARDRIALHSYQYYRALFDLAAENSAHHISIKLLSAGVDGRFVAGIVVAIKGDMAWYLYGASSNEKRNYMPNYGLQWEAIRIARNAGCKYYDFFGIPPADDPDHPMHGLYRFKTGFGGDFFTRYGCYDVILRPFYYSGYSLAEKGRTFYFKKIKKMTG